jgi:hypothetical protein
MNGSTRYWEPVGGEGGAWDLRGGTMVLGVIGRGFCGPVLPLQGALNCFWEIIFPGLQPAWSGTSHGG